jgi:hypothetical protein
MNDATSKPNSGAQSIGGEQHHGAGDLGSDPATLRLAMRRWSLILDWNDMTTPGGHHEVEDQCHGGGRHDHDQILDVLLCTPRILAEPRAPRRDRGGEGKVWKIDGDGPATDREPELGGRHDRLVLDILQEPLRWEPAPEAARHRFAIRQTATCGKL